MLVHGALIDAEILTSPLPHIFAQLGPLLGADALSMGMPTPPKWSKSVPMCIINLQKNLVHGALIDAKILTSPLPHVFALLGPFWGDQCSAHGCANTFQVSKSVPMSCRNLQKCWCMGP